MYVTVLFWVLRYVSRQPLSLWLQHRASAVVLMPLTKLSGQPVDLSTDPTSTSTGNILWLAGQDASMVKPVPKHLMADNCCWAVWSERCKKYIIFDIILNPEYSLSKHSIHVWHNNTIEVQWHFKALNKLYLVFKYFFLFIHYIFHKNSHLFLQSYVNLSFIR